MIYFYKTRIAVSEPINEKTIQDILKSKFAIKSGQGYFTIVRNRMIGNRGLLRIFFPVLFSKITIKDNFLYCKTKLDGLAFFMLLMTVGAIIVELKMDRHLYPREYPVFLPFVIFFWYMLSIIFEAYRMKITLSKDLSKNL
jgi:hypothetical protein